MMATYRWFQPEGIPGTRWRRFTIAALADLPLALLLIAGTLRLVQLTAIRMWLIEPATPLWRLPLMT